MTLAFDIGGTKIRRAVFDGDRLGAIDIFPTNGGDLLDKLEALIAEIAQKQTIDFVGASFAGQVCGNLVASAPNIALGKLAHTDFSEFVRAKFGVRGAIDNDLKCAVLAEAAAGPDAKSLFALFVGTGIGGAAIEGGRVVRGALNNAGEIGHIPFEKTPFLCGCGGAECLEASASGGGVAKWIERYGLKGAVLSDLERSPDPKAAEILARFDRGIAHAVKTIAALFNPQTIVIGGGVAIANQRVLAAAKNALKTVFKPSRNIAIELSELGDNANLIGAALLKRDR